VHFIVVATEEIMPQARKLAHSISLMPEHSASVWTDKHYRDNEPTVAGKMRVIFLGKNKISESYESILPERFSAYETKCLWEGPKALLLLDSKIFVTAQELTAFTAAVKDKKAELTKSASAAGLTSMTGSILVIASLFCVLPVSFALTAIFPFVFGTSANKRRKAYLELQFDYMFMRFIGEEFQKFAAITGGE